MLSATNRLRSKREFKYAFKKGNSLNSRYLVLVAVKNFKKYSKFGIVVTKKIGNAVCRNSVKRKIREILRINLANIKTGYNFILLTKPGIETQNYTEIQKSIVFLLEKGGYLNKCELL